MGSYKIKEVGCGKAKSAKEIVSARDVGWSVVGIRDEGFDMGKVKVPIVDEEEIEGPLGKELGKLV